MRQAALLVAVVCLLAVPVAGAVGAPGAQSSAPLQDDSTPAALQDASAPERSGVDVTVQIRPDGDARWTVSSKYPLGDANDTAAFERLRTEFEAAQTDSEFSTDVFRAVVPRVSDRVGREMEIRNVDRSSRIVEAANNSTGVLAIQFTWTNFSRVENGDSPRLVVDSFSGGWFGDLAADQTLTIRTPEGYDTDQVQPGPNSITNGAYQWSGPQSFGADQPRVVFTEAGSPVGVSLLVVAVVVVVALLAGAAFVWMYYRGSSPSWLESDGEASDESTVDATADSAADEQPRDPATEAGAGAAAGGAAADADEEDDGVDPELLSDEERVERLLREHGGRMKQSKIVEETRWSTAKVSQLLSSMAEEGRVEKLRIGRENLISLPGEGVDEE